MLGATQSASMFSMSVNDQQNAMTIYTQALSQTQKQQQQRWQIMTDTQTKIFEINQDVTQNIAKTQQNLFKKWDEYIRG